MCFALASCSAREDAFFVRDAELERADYLRSLDLRTQDERASDRDRFGVFAHRVQSGHGTILAVRRFDAGNRFTVDDETFLKVTVWLRSALSSKRSVIDLAQSQDAIAVYSRGGSAWPQNTCSGYLASGSIAIEQSGRKYKIKMRSTLDPSGNRGVWDTCHPAPVDVEFLAVQTQVDRLTPWLGSAGAHIYDETYR